MVLEWLRRRNIQFKYEENEKKTKQYELREEELHLIHVFFVLYEMQLCCNFNDLCCIHVDVYVCICYAQNTYDVYIIPMSICCRLNIWKCWWANLLNFVHKECNATAMRCCGMKFFFWKITSSSSSFRELLLYHIMVDDVCCLDLNCWCYRHLCLC